VNSLQGVGFNEDWRISLLMGYAGSDFSFSNHDAPKSYFDLTKTTISSKV